MSVSAQSTTSSSQLGLPHIGKTMWASLAAFAIGFGCGLVSRRRAEACMREFLVRLGCLRPTFRTRYIPLTEAPDLQAVAREVWQFVQHENVHNTSVPLIGWWQDMQRSHSLKLAHAWHGGYRGEVELEDDEGYVIWTVNLGTMEQISHNGNVREVRRINILD